MKKEGVEIHIHDNGLGEITFFHPSHNSLPSELLQKLAHTIKEAGENAAISLILIKSGGDRTFCAGANFQELLAIDNRESGLRFFSGFANIINECRKCPKLIVGRVQGKAVGGGVGIASAVDYCMATKYASVKLSELNIGIGPFVVGPAVERKIGVSAMSQLAINADTFQSAEWAREKGLYTEIFDSAEELDQGIEELCNKLLSYNHEAMKRLKKTFWTGTEDWDDLLKERALESGSLVLMDHTKEILSRYK
jgi:methylglutaconyl-CoA hydratase